MATIPPMRSLCRAPRRQVVPRSLTSPSRTRCMMFRQRERIGGIVAIMPGDLIEVGDGRSVCRFPRVQARPGSTTPGSNGDGDDSRIGELLCDARGYGVAAPVAMSRLHSPGHPSDMVGRQMARWMGRTRRMLEQVQDAGKLQASKLATKNFLNLVPDCHLTVGRNSCATYPGWCSRFLFPLPKSCELTSGLGSTLGLACRSKVLSAANA